MFFVGGGGADKSGRLKQKNAYFERILEGEALCVSVLVVRCGGSPTFSGRSGN